MTNLAIKLSCSTDGKRFSHLDVCGPLCRFHGFKNAKTSVEILLANIIAARMIANMMGGMVAGGISADDSGGDGGCGGINVCDRNEQTPATAAPTCRSGCRHAASVSSLSM